MSIGHQQRRLERALTTTHANIDHVATVGLGTSPLEVDAPTCPNLYFSLPLVMFPWSPTLLPSRTSARQHLANFWFMFPWSPTLLPSRTSARQHLANFWFLPVFQNFVLLQVRCHCDRRHVQCGKLRVTFHCWFHFGGLFSRRHCTRQLDLLKFQVIYWRCNTCHTNSSLKRLFRRECSLQML
jgi:hypothetical protein